jgi:hypothetical protein
MGLEPTTSAWQPDRPPAACVLGGCHVVATSRAYLRHDAQDARVRWQVRPVFLRLQSRLLVRRQVELKDREGFAEVCCGRRDDPVCAELVRDSPNPLAPSVVTRRRLKIPIREVQNGTIHSNAKVEDVREVHLDRQQATRPDEFGTHAVDIVEQVPIRLNDNGVRRAPEIQNGVSAGRTPSSTSIAPRESPDRRRDVTLEHPVDGSRSAAGDGDDEAPVQRTTSLPSSAGQWPQ